MYSLDCSIQTYAWGKRGVDSLVAIYKQAQNKQFKIDETKTYAELWMGTHVNGPSLLNLNNDKIIKLNEYLTQKEGKSSNVELPFLFKILSVNQALSIQAHPNKELAKKLHIEQPINYPDSNHKPEMLIALNDFEALCGFRPVTQIIKHFELIKQLVNLCDENNVIKFQDLHKINANNVDLEAQLKLCFNSMMNKSNVFVTEQVNSLLNEIESLKLSFKSDNETSLLLNLFERLHKQYPFDIGCFSIFLMNYTHLKPTEAIYLKANVPHAYLSGDGVECMACSDNVVRAGLTPKYKDVNTLVNMLDYQMADLTINMVKAEYLNKILSEYKPNVNEFSVQCVNIKVNDANEQQLFNLPVMNKYSILIVIKAIDYIEAVTDIDSNKLKLSDGLVYFIDKNVQVHFSLTKKIINSSSSSSNNETLLLAYRAYCNVEEAE